MSERELLMVLGSALLHAVWSASIKGSRDPLGFGVVQGAIGLALTLLLLPFFELGEVPAAVWRLLAATSVAHGLYFYFMCRAYESAELSLVYPITRSAPAFLPFVAIPLLGETISPAGALGIAVVVAGIWLLHAGELTLRQAARHVGTRFALLTLAASVGYSLLDKRAMMLLSETAWSGPAPRAVVFFFLLFVGHMFVFAPLALARSGLAGLARSLRLDAGRGALALLASVLSYGLILEAFRTAAASYVVAVRQTSVVFALGLGLLWLHERPSRPRVIGACATAAGVALIAAFP